MPLYLTLSGGVHALFDRLDKLIAANHMTIRSYRSIKFNPISTPLQFLYNATFFASIKPNPTRQHSPQTPA
jgi:hypothetical protein